MAQPEYTHRITACFDASMAAWVAQTARGRHVGQSAVLRELVHAAMQEAGALVVEPPRRRTKSAAKP